MLPLTVTVLTRIQTSAASNQQLHARIMTSSFQAKARHQLFCTISAAQGLGDKYQQIDYFRFTDIAPVQTSLAHKVVYPFRTSNYRYTSYDHLTTHLSSLLVP